MTATDHDDDFRSDFSGKYQEESAKMGRFNLAVFGLSGVGKSTLINAIFGKDVAPTGTGRPVTANSHLYVHDSGQLGIYDTQGIELGTDGARALADVRAFVEAQRAKPLEQQIHVAYYCVRGMDGRIQPFEEEFVRGLHELGLPVILVLTQVPKRGEQYHDRVVEVAQYIYETALPIYLGRPILTNALADPALGFPQHGLVELLDLTFEVAPEGVESALAAAQKIDMRRKRAAALKRIEVATAAATTAGASPIPFSDAVVLVPIQLGMMASVSVTYDIPVNTALAASITATSLATQTGRAAAVGLLKLIPGAGTVAGGVVSATVAGSFTFAMGIAWREVCEGIVAGKFGAIGSWDEAGIKAAFASVLKEQFTRQMKLRKNKDE